MSELKSLRVVVAGAGAVGSTVALHLLRAGAQVTLCDPSPLGDNASGVAAGMLAPLSESLLDAATEGRLPLLRQGRDAWLGLLSSLGAPVETLDRSGAILLAPAGVDPSAFEAALKGLDPAARRLAPQQMAALHPGLEAANTAWFTGEDWRLEPMAALSALQAAFVREGGALQRRVVRGEEAADAVVLAIGAAAAPWAEARELDMLWPVKGQILRFAGQGPSRGPVIRGEGVYIAPSAGGALVGATMEPGVADRRIDPEAVAMLAAAARRLLPALTGAPQAQAGVRAATPDALPLAGASSRPGLMLAVGARRNGWLLAPLMAEAVAAALAGRRSDPVGRAFDPLRFR